jgi:hypothetical protein
MDERAAQVQLMTEIYQGASAVDVWLTENTENGAGDTDSSVSSDDPLEWQLLKHKMPAPALKRPEYPRMLGEEEDIPENDPIATSKYQTPQWFMTALLSHRFWSRAWIVQEIVVAKLVNIHFLSRSFDWDRMMTEIGDFDAHVYEKIVFGSKEHNAHAIRSSLELIHQNLKGQKSIRSIAELRRTFQGGQLDSVSEVLAASAGCLSGDPRDKVFAMLGLASQPQHTAAQHPGCLVHEEHAPRGLKSCESDGREVEYGCLRPTYIKSISQVYVEAASATFMSYRDGPTRKVIDPMLFAGIGWPRNVTNIPSWVTDWSSIPEAGEALLSGFSEHAGSFQT